MKFLQRQFSIGKIQGHLCRVLLAMVFCLGLRTAVGADGYWVNGGGGSWASAGNWDAADGIAAGADNNAYFGFAREAAISPNASFTLDGAQTVGNICFTAPGSGHWSFNPGANGSLTLDSTFGPSQLTVTAPSLQVSLNVVVAGSAGLQKDGAGTLVLSAKNTYGGETFVNGGGLNVAGAIGSGVNVTGGTLSGAGTINGPVLIGAGGVLALGNSPGPLTINNSLTLLPGSTTAVTIHTGSAGHPFVQGLSTITYGGSLLVNVPAGGMSLGQTFSIFGGAPGSGDFSSIQPPPGPWLRWRIDPATGQITVVSSASQPAVASVSMAETSLTLHFTNGPPGSAGYIVASTDLDQPMANWKRIATNMFDMSGSLIFTNLMNANDSSQVFLSAFVVPSP